MFYIILERKEKEQEELEQEVFLDYLERIFFQPKTVTQDTYLFSLQSAFHLHVLQPSPTAIA